MELKVIDEYGLRSVGDAEVGIEIEMEGKALVIPPPLQYWEQKNDGSLRGEAIEYVLRQPVKRDVVDSRLKYLQKKLKHPNVKLVPSDRCGVHVHLNFQQLTTEEVFKTIILYYMLEDILIKWCGEDREGNLFCLRARDAEHIIPTLVEARRSNTLRHMQSNSYRYAALNVSSLRKYGSLEFRSLRTPINFNKINKWVKILLAVKDRALETDSPIALVETCSLKGHTQFLKDVFAEHYDDLYCPNMQDMLMDNVRNIQDLAYSKPKKFNTRPFKTGYEYRQPGLTTPNTTNLLNELAQNIATPDQVAPRRRGDLERALREPRPVYAAAEQMEQLRAREPVFTADRQFVLTHHGWCELAPYILNMPSPGYRLRVNRDMSVDMLDVNGTLVFRDIR